MNDASQIYLPESFSQLFRGPGGRLLQPATHILARYELCEDLAASLVEQAQHLYHGGNSDEAAVLLALFHSLSVPEAGLAGHEARWVTLRLAELLNWRSPELPSA